MRSTKYFDYLFIIFFLFHLIHTSFGVWKHSYFIFVAFLTFCVCGLLIVKMSLQNKSDDERNIYIKKKNNIRSKKKIMTWTKHTLISSKWIIEYVRVCLWIANVHQFKWIILHLASLFVCLICFFFFLGWNIISSIEMNGIIRIEYPNHNNWFKRDQFNER